MMMMIIIIVIIIYFFLPPVFASSLVWLCPSWEQSMHLPLPNNQENFRSEYQHLRSPHWFSQTSYGTCWENFLKKQNVVTFAIVLFVLKTCLFDQFK